MASIHPQADRPQERSLEERFNDSDDRALALCDICSLEVEPDDGFALGGEGLFVTTRGEEVRREAPKVCSSCAVGIGVHSHFLGVLSEDDG